MGGENPVRLGRAGASPSVRFDVRADADPTPARVGGALPLPAERVVAGHLQGRVQGLAERSAVENHARDVGVGCLIRPDHVQAPQLRRIPCFLPGDLVYQQLAGGVRGGPSHPPVRGGGRLVGEDGQYLAFEVLDPVQARQEQRRQIGFDECAGAVVRVGAGIPGDLGPYGTESACLVDAHLQRNDLLFGLRGGDQVLTPVLYPPHGPLQRHRSEGHCHLFRRGRDLLAEPASHVGDDHPHPRLGEAGADGQAAAQQVMALGRGENGQPPPAGVVGGQAASRLHGNRGRPSSMELGSIHLAGRCQRLRRVSELLHFPEDDVRAEVGEQLRGPGAGRRARIGDGG